MHAFLIALLFSRPIDAHGSPLNARLQQRDTRCEQPLTRVVLMVDGSSEWPGEASSRTVEELKAALGSCYALQVVRFDAAPTLQLAYTAKSPNRDFIEVSPRTPMREAMEMGLARLIDARGPHIMVVIAHRQLYPTTVSTARLNELARQSETKVHTIHLAAESGGSRRLGRTLKNGIIRHIAAFGQEELECSARDTARLLKVIAYGTGGEACVAADDHMRIECARSIGAAIMAGPQ